MFDGPKEPLEDLDPSSFPHSPYASKMEVLMKKAFLLGIETDSEVLMLFGLGGHVQQYATHRFEPLVIEVGGRALLIKLLLDDDGKPRDLPDTFTGDVESAWPDDAEATEKCRVDAAFYIEDDGEREQVFRRTVLWMQQKLREIAHIGEDSPEWAPDVLLLIATPNGKIMSFESPCFRPLITEEAGQRMIKTILNRPRKSVAPTTENE